VTATVDCSAARRSHSLGMANPAPPAPGSRPDPVNTVQEVLKCKWVLLILGAIQDGQCRPSSIERSIDGLSHKILHQRLDKLTRLQVVERVELTAKMQQVEYRMTAFGTAIGKLVRDIQALRY
jgi:DNA-binding HxlR family transcriptional regulator